MTVPARRPDLRCPGCMKYRLRDAPRDCTRCAMEEAEQIGFKVFNMTEMSVWFDEDRWADVGRHFQRRWINDYGFYVYGAHTGGRLSLPMTPLLSCQPDSNLGFSSMTLASLAAVTAAGMFSCVWVITSIGGWEIEDTDF